METITTRPFIYIPKQYFIWSVRYSLPRLLPFWAAFVLGVCLLVAPSLHDPILMALALLATVAFFPLLLVIGIAVRLRDKKVRELFVVSRLLSASTAGVKVWVPGGSESTIVWRDFKRVNDRGDFLGFELVSKQRFMVGKDAFESPDDIDRVLALAKEHIPK